ncbi:6572_t:CDS:2, partial [Entrophospora sp. SA101]
MQFLQNLQNKNYGTFNYNDPNKSSHTSRANLESNDRNVVEISSQPFYQRFPSTIIIRNVGSMARDQFSIQRTCLSFIKFGIALFLVGISFLIHIYHIDNGDDVGENPNSSNELFNLSISFFPSEETIHNIIGLMFISLGFFVIIWATCNYLKFQKMFIDSAVIIQNEEFDVSVMMTI